MPAATDIMTPLWRGVVALRIVTAAFAIGSILVHQSGLPSPAVSWALLGAIAVWTAVSCLAYSYDATRRMSVIATDLVVTLALLASSLLVLPAEQLSAVTPLLTVVWACGPVVAAAAYAGRFVGVLAGVAVSVVDAWVHSGFTTEVVRDAVLLVTTGFGFGLAATTARWASEQLRRAARAEVATVERERVARSIHDSVLRVLSRMQAGNGQLDGDAEELTRLAGEQEVALRSLITTAAPGAAISGEDDLGAALQDLAGAKVEVSVPAVGVPLPAADVEELVALTRVALAETARHAGPETKSWVLVEDLGDEVVLTVRDDGDADDRSDLSRETRERSDRIADLGGTLTRDAGPGRGAEWEVRLARTRRELHR